MSLNIRPAVPERDFEAVAALLSIYEDEPVSEAQLLENNRQHVNEGRIIRQFVAEQDDRVVGYATSFRQSWMKAGRYLVKVWVSPNHCKQGIGAQLYRNASGFAIGQGAQSLESNVFDNDPNALHFAEKYGFIISRHLFESTIDLRQFDAVLFEGVLEQVQATGIRLFTLADAGHTAENLRKLWEVNYATYMDDPGSTGTFPDFAEFQKLTDGAAWFDPAGQFLAADGNQYVGLAALRYNPENRSGYNMMTGVMPAYRGRKIALALKLMTIRYARCLGALTIRTDNDSQNAPMLAINRKLGYMPQPGIYRLEKHHAE